MADTRLQDRRILVVDDEVRMVRFIRLNLEHDGFQVIEAYNGMQALERIRTNLPDLVLLDVMMPDIDGFEVLRTIREISQVPVIMLTAKGEEDDRVRGLELGADDYITKPFSSEFLHARIENLMAQRQQLQQFYRSQITTSSKPEFSLPPLEIKSQEDLFMKKLIALMNENIDNFELNIDYLATELGMSRTVFFNKLKSLTGYSPVEFVREVRFERAAEYIRNSELTVSEISYQVGIEDPRYFSRCFKQKYGLTPSEYRLQNAN